MFLRLKAMIDSNSATPPSASAKKIQWFQNEYLRAYRSLFPIKALLWDGRWLCCFVNVSEKRLVFSIFLSRRVQAYFVRYSSYEAECHHYVQLISFHTLVSPASQIFQYLDPSLEVSVVRRVARGQRYPVARSSYLSNPLLLKPNTYCTCCDSLFDFFPSFSLCSPSCIVLHTSSNVPSRRHKCVSSTSFYAFKQLP